MKTSVWVIELTMSEPRNNRILSCSPLGTPSFAKACHTLMQALSSDPQITIDAEAIRTLNLKPLDTWLAQPLETLLQAGAALEIRYAWPRPAEDPRELSECPEPRLWALKADAQHPWLPLLLDRTSGSLAQHVAMLVPHDFSASEGIRFDPQALELWITHRLMLLDHLGARSGQAGQQRGNLSLMAASLGFELDAGFWELLDQSR